LQKVIFKLYPEKS